jgi:hypothetical protein
MTSLAQARQIIREHNKANRKRLKASKPPRIVKAGQAPRVKEPLYLAWIRRLPCVACMTLGVVQTSRIEAAHVRAGFPADGWRPTGMMEKPSDRRCTPLCRWHHQDAPDAQHRGNERSWWEALRIYPPALCAALSAAYDANGDGAAVILRFVAEARAA